ncbi:MAG: hypothetical protein V4801_01890 [Burkholderia gladioli]
MSTPEQPSVSLVRAPRIGWTVALSLVFYAIALSAGLHYNPARGFWHSKADVPATADGETIVGTVSADPPTLVGNAPAGLLLAQALDCAQAGQWECMGRANEAAQALQGVHDDASSEQAQAPAAPSVATTAANTAAAATLAAAPVAALAATRPGAAPASRSTLRTWKVSARLHPTPHRRPIQRVAYRVPARPLAPDPFFANLYRH